MSRTLGLLEDLQGTSSGRRVPAGKIPFIPLLLVNNSFVTDFKEKANLFNESFCKQCTPVANDSTLPTLLETPNETLYSLEIIAIVILEKLSKH